MHKTVSSSMWKVGLKIRSNLSVTKYSVLQIADFVLFVIFHDTTIQSDNVISGQSYKAHYDRKLRL